MPTVEHLIARPDVAALLERIAEAPVLEEAIAIQQVPAPTFHEHARADFVQRLMAAAGLEDIASDAVCNVYGRLPGTESTLPALLIAAHTDTVFDAETDLTVRRKGGRAYGPGLGDNSLGVAALVTLARQMQAARCCPPCDIWFVANSREEGLGNLEGINAALKRLEGHIGAAMVLEGMVLGRVYHGGIGVRRYKITCTGPGGHSWGHFGQPSAIHALVRLGTRLTQMHMPQKPRSTYNIGMIEGGESINTIAPKAALYLDLRAETAEGVEALERKVLDIVATADGAEARGAKAIGSLIDGAGGAPPRRAAAGRPLAGGGGRRSAGSRRDVARLRCGQHRCKRDSGRRAAGRDRGHHTRGKCAPDGRIHRGAAHRAGNAPDRAAGGAGGGTPGRARVKIAVLSFAPVDL